VTSSIVDIVSAEMIRRALGLSLNLRMVKDRYDRAQPGGRLERVTYMATHRLALAPIKRVRKATKPSNSKLDDFEVEKTATRWRKQENIQNTCVLSFLAATMIAALAIIVIDLTMSPIKLSVNICPRPRPGSRVPHDRC
jgi:hypothetical protein